MYPATPPPAERSALWSRLQALDLDSAAALSFTHRLARDNGWPPAYARRVVLEYKKFVYLAATAGHPVTPSDEVDQAWHLHLVYTRLYWDELCDGILGFRLHHGPTQGGVAEGAKFADWYGRTLDSYRAAFGEDAPTDIWPAPAERFGEASHFRRINVRRHWLIRRPRLRPVGRLLGRLRQWAAGRWLAPALLALLVLAGCTARTPLNPFDWYGPEFLGLFWALLLTVLPLALWARQQGRGPELPYDGSPLDPYELARLAERGQRLADSALAALAYEGSLEVLPEQRVRVNLGCTPAHAYERAVWESVKKLGQPTIADVRSLAQENNWPAQQALDQSLVSRGLLLPPAERARLDRYPQVVTLALGAFGLVKVLVGLGRGRPVGLLLASLGVLVLAYVVSRYGRAWATGRGAWLLARSETVVRQERQAGNLSSQLVGQQVALFGLAGLQGLGLGTLATALAPPRPDGSGADGGGDSGGGDGGSGCGGGGCGGCGGCGS